MNDEPIIPRDVELHEIREFFVWPKWKALKESIELEMEEFKEFILHPWDFGTETTVSENALLARVNEFVLWYIDQFSIEHFKKALKKFIVDDNERKMLYRVGGDRRTLSERDVYRAQCKILRHFLSFEEFYREKDWQENQENNNSSESWLDPLWEWVWISLQS